jgi:amino acid adenylation domain-containing protein
VTGPLPAGVEPRLTPVLLPVDRPRGPTRPVRAAETRFALPADLVEKLHRYAAGQLLDAFDVLLAAFVLVLGRHSGQSEVVMGTGHLVFAIDTSEEESFTEFVERVRAATDVAGLAHSSFVPVVCQLADQSSIDAELCVDVALRADGVTAHLRYLVDLFDADTIERLHGHWHTLLAAALAQPATPVAALPMLTTDELRRQLIDWNATRVPLGPDRPIHEHVADRCAAQPDAIAVIQGDTSYTYRELDERANQLANHLIGLGVRRGSLVGLCLRRGPDWPIAILAVLKAGAAYVPLDGAYPAARLDRMVRQSDCAVLVAGAEFVDRLPARAAPIVRIDADAHLIGAASRSGPAVAVGRDDLCYVIYTSGSTGRPKGIVLRHGGVANNLLDLDTRFHVGPRDRVLAVSSPSFDMSVYEVLGTMIAGATIVMPEPDGVADPAHWVRLVTGHQVTVWNSAPALAELFVGALSAAGRTAPSLRLAMFGGDWIPLALPDRLRALAPNLVFVALGGATEASIHSTIHEVREVDFDRPSIPYGRPMANQRTYILDAARRPVPVGVPGELYLAGDGLARGYLNQPDLTAQRFTTWSFGPVRDERVYRTGDLAKYRVDGEIELLGRIDSQIKIRGLRIELGEVEAALREHPGVVDAVATAKADRAGDRRLVGYVTSRDPELDPEAVRATATDALPAYMVPAAVVVLATLPLSPNGKVDRTMLPEPPSSRPAPAGARRRDDLETRITEVLADVLGLDEVGLDEDFFTLGGDSWKAMIALQQIGCEPLRVADMFGNPTVRGLAAAVRGHSGHDNPHPPKETS